MTSESKGTLRVLQLYPKDMNIYGDWGNALVLQQRIKWHGYTPELLEYNVGDEFPDDVDLIVGGGGQDSGQVVIQEDLQGRAAQLRSMAEDGAPMLVICGLYQLFGKFFKTNAGPVIPGIGILDVETQGTDERLIGNVTLKSPEFGEILGYENHSGQTTLGPGVEPLGTVTKGAGNNSKDGHEGARYRNVVASYLHGSLLPKNPAIADFLIKTAAERKFGEFVPGKPDDGYARLAREHAARRPR
ncbi:type 1 glutamine amidotransferase [Paenarthrobacter ureafaciens]|uniref:type 1 glutamine amidotransferase n=1 Tax=Paenarthrobacter ureafaciens TaxID=37931 RepID=UPI001FB2E877|nr:glutamine amidotransferase [Paenarthrobacter ureafaciens]UOD79697.1 glutamine amidotransferase [Paenarthrobacter ureafaciens]WNZ04961.1 glutamine amidotransferase [Paenarthrobacter ureafaciens]